MLRVNSLLAVFCFLLPACSTLGESVRDREYVLTIEEAAALFFSVPTSQSPAGSLVWKPVIDREIRAKANLSEQVVVVFSGSWDYGGGMFKPARGTLSVDIFFDEALNSLGSPPTLDALSKEIVDSYERYEERAGRRIRKLPNRFGERSINGADWLTYVPPAHDHYSWNLAAPVDEYGLIRVIVGIQLFGVGDDFLDEAKAQARSIVESLRLVVH